MAEPVWLTALYPQRYTGSWSLPTGAIRLFGDGWAFSILPDVMPASPYGGADIVFNASKFATPHRTSSYLQWHRRNAFALNYGQQDFQTSGIEQPGEYFYTYNPVNQGAAAGGLSTPLVARFLQNAAALPLYQLLQGRIEVPQEASSEAQVGRQRLLAALRKECGIKLTTGTQHRSIFLYADGICLFGRVLVPGGAGELDGWFKIGTRAMAIPGALTSEVGRGLSLCLDETLPGNGGDDGYLARWRNAFKALRSVFSKAAFIGAKWLSAESLGTAGLESLFWPGTSKPGGSPDYFRREKDSPLHIDGGIARLRLCPDGLVLSPHRLAIAGDANQLMLDSVAQADSYARDCPSLHYRYERSKPTDEKIDVRGNRADRAKSCKDNPRAVKLTIPLIETAYMLRRESGMPESGEVGLDVLRPVWTFSQLDNGLLHWAFPDATAEAISALLEKAPEAPPIGASPERLDETVGAILLGNRPDREGFRTDLRPWSVAITECRDLALALRLVKVGDAFVLDQADVWIGEHEMVLEGAVQVIPFRQTRERLLPDHDERALRTTSLRAVTPGLLQGLEQAAQQRLADVVGAFLEIEGMCLSPTTLGISSDPVSMKVTLPCRDPEAPSPIPEEIEAIRPWIWTWHDRLPCVQAHGLAQTGVELSQPSGLRQLAPFRRDKGSRKLNYVFDGALNPTRLAPGLRLDRQVGEGGVYAAPELDHDYASEVGMAALTLPSVTFFPGHRDLGENQMPDRLHEDASVDPPAWIWPIGNQSRRFLVEVRQDLALRDEFYGQAAVGPDVTDDGVRTPGVLPPQDRFEPLDTNGPQAWGKTDGEIHSWKRLWALRNRQAALAATESRALITRQGPKRMLANLLPQGPLDISLTLRLERVGNDIGAVEVRDKKGALIATMRGLPNAGDLEGITGAIGGVSLEQGTAKLGLDGSQGWRFTDQRGLTSSALTRDGLITRREVGKATLVSCVRPLKAATPPGISAIHFWFTDVPLEIKADVATLAHGDVAHNHTQGFRWAVSQAEGAKDSLGLGGCLAFLPLALAKVSGDAAAPGLKLMGMLEVRSVSGTVPQHAEDAAASVGLSTQAMPSVDVGSDLVLRLTDPGVTGTAPVVLKIIPPGKAMLYFELLGRSFEFSLKRLDPLSTSPSHLAGALPLEFKLDAPPTAAPLALTAIDVSLSDSKGPKAVLTYAFAFESGGGVLKGGFTIDVIEGIVKSTETLLVLPGLSIPLPGTVRLAQDCLLMNWGDANPTALTVTSGLFAGAVITAHSGHLAAVLDEALGVPKSLSAFELEFDIRFTTTLDGVKVPLVLTGNSTGLYLSGRAAVATTHDIELAWCGERLETIADDSVQVAAHVVHCLKEDEPRTRLVLPQYVVLARSKSGLTTQCNTVAVCRTGPSKSWLVQLRDGNLTGAELAPLTAGQQVRARARLNQALAGDGWVTDFLPIKGMPITRDLGLPELARDWTPSEAYGISPSLSAALDGARGYSDVLAIFAKIQAGVLMSAPRIPPQANAHAGYRLSVTDSNGARFVEIGRFAPDIVQGSIGDRSLRRWVVGILSDRAPWAKGALLQIRGVDGRPPRTLVIDRDAPGMDEGTEHKLSVRARPRPSAFLTKPDTPVVSDPRRVSLPSGDANVLGGFRPVHVAARTFTSGKDGAGDHLLSVRALERAWRLDVAGDAAASAYSNGTDDWLQDCIETRFRNASNASSGRLAAESPADVPEMRAAGGLYPVAGDSSERVTAAGWLVQSVVPAYNVTREFAPRPGIAQTARLGLSTRSIRSTDGFVGGERAAAFAPEVPFHAITPRPPLIGVNDRLRCDEFNSEVAAGISLKPTFVLYGPSAEPPARFGVRPGVKREPLASVKASVTLAHPEHGLIDQNWDGRLEFAASVGEKVAIRPIWINVDINGRFFYGDLSKEDDPMSIDCFAIRDMDLSPQDSGYSEDAKARGTLGGLFRSLTLSTRARVEVGFLFTAEDTKGQERRIGRRIVFDLPVSPRPASRLELPHYFRFEDPEYNDLIERRFAVKKRGGMTIVAERDKVRPDGTVILVAGQDVPCGWIPVLTLEKPAKGETPSQPIHLEPPSPFGQRCWLIDCRRLFVQVPSTEQSQRQRAEVRDTLSVFTGAGDPIKINVTDDEPFAKNPASLAVIQALESADRVPLFAPMSPPSMVELVDPFDLLDGVARYRSSYGWRLFSPDKDVAYRLQKIGGNGAMHLSSALKISKP